MQCWSCNLTDIKLLLLTVCTRLLRNDGVDKAVLPGVTFTGNAVVAWHCFPSVCRYCVGDAKCIQIVVDCFRDTLESFRRLPTTLMQLKASVHYCRGNRHGQLKITLAASCKNGKISKIQEPQMSLSQVRRCCNPETFTLTYNVKSKNSIANNLK